MADSPYSCSLLHPGRETAFLNADFESADRPALVTALLALAAIGPSTVAAGPDDRVTASLWKLSVASRLKRLLRVVRHTEGIAALELQLRCPHADCRQFLVIELAFDALDGLHDEAADRELLEFPDSNSRPLAFRRPTGEDLRRWRCSALTDGTDFRSMAQSLLVSGAGENHELPSPETFAAAFAEFDSLVGFQVLSACPHCQREATLPLDLETLALSRLQSVQRRLIRENHRLALAYGWSERDILQVPRGRRLHYLAQLEEAT
jgi:hypothetical protein